MLRRLIGPLLGVLLVWMLLAAPAYAANPHQGNVIHVVRQGETLFSIARRYGTSVEAICAANGIADPARIYTGQRLVIPAHRASAAPAVAGTTHVVRVGENLYRIALRYGTTVAALARLNGIRNPNRVFAGQRLIIPGKSAASAPAAPAAGPKRIVVDLSEQHLYAYQGDALVYSFVVSTGRRGAGTRTGTFRVLDKLPSAYSSAWNLRMPYWLGIYWAGASENGIHALPILANGQRLWAGYLGTPISFGCIVLGTQEARLLYEWADIGTPVVIRP